MLKRLNIAIDGPAGAGKSTMAKWVARHYQYQLIDTGAMYRSIAYLAQYFHVSLESEPELIKLCRETHFQFRLMPDLTNEIWVNGRDISTQIRSGHISMVASDISRLPGVRETLVHLQQEMAYLKGTVMEGRDIGTVVLPDADVKFFLIASVEVRATRRLKDLKGIGESPTLEELIAEISARDHQDQTRVHSPLRQAKHAIVIDTTNFTITEAFCELRKHIDTELKKLEPV